MLARAWLLRSIPATLLWAQDAHVCLRCKSAGPSEESRVAPVRKYAR